MGTGEYYCRYNSYMDSSIAQVIKLYTQAAQFYSYELIKLWSFIGLGVGVGVPSSRISSGLKVHWFGVGCTPKEYFLRS
jgi:hypothetical protein